MKQFNRSLITMIILSIVGIGIILCGVFSHTDYLLTTGICLTFVATIKVIQKIIIKSNDKMMKKYLLAANEERNLSIAYQAGYVAFTVAILGLAISTVTFAVLEIKLVSNILCLVMLGLYFVYLITYLILNKYN